MKEIKRGDVTSVASPLLLMVIMCLSVDNFSVFVFIFIQSFFVSGHGAQAHTHVREAAIVIKVLHGDLLSEVGEHHDAIVGAGE